MFGFLVPGYNDLQITDHFVYLFTHFKFKFTELCHVAITDKI